MALTRIEYGSLASSSVMNNNFDYLDERISNISENISTSTASINSNIASINSSVTNLGQNFQESLNTLQNSIYSVFSLNGLYVTTYTNGTSWYREYFSDSEKTTRIWLEQGGYSWNPVFIKLFANTNYTAVATGTVNQYAIRIESKNTGSMTFNQWQTASGISNTTPVWWYVCGK